MTVARDVHTIRPSMSQCLAQTSNTVPRSITIHDGCTQTCQMQNAPSRVIALQSSMMCLWQWHARCLLSAMPGTSLVSEGAEVRMCGRWHRIKEGGICARVRNTVLVEVCH